MGDKYSDYSFIAVYNKDAEFQWQVSGPENTSFKQRVWNVHMATDGSVYGLGRFSGVEDFKPGSAKRELTSGPLGSMYIQKFDKDGDFLWAVATPFPGIPYESIERPNGNLLIAGDNSADTTILLKNGSTATMYQGVFVLEIDKDGNFINAGSSKGGANTHYHDIRLDASGNVYVCGAYDGTLDVDLGPNETLQSTTRAIDAFVVAYDKDLKYKWHKAFGDVGTNPPSWDKAQGLYVASNGDVYVSGRFTYSVDFDPVDNPGKTVLVAETRSQSPDGFIMKYSSTGALQWVKQIGGDAQKNSWNTDVDIYHMVSDGKYLYVAGELTGVGDFDPSAAEYIMHAEDGATCMWYGQYTLDGEFEKAFIIDDTIDIAFKSGYEICTDIEIMDGSLYAYGTFQKHVDFDPGSGLKILSCDSTGANYAGDNDIFIAKWQMINSVGIDPMNAQKFGIYPNPASHVLNIANPYSNVSSYSITDINGRILLRGTLTSMINSIDINPLANGMYYVQIQNGEQVLTEKLMVR
jgi:hypothetical protein